MAAAAAGSSAATFILPAPLSLSDKAAAGGGGGGVDGAGADCGVCAICLDKIALQETALVKGCDHAYCVTCILRQLRPCLRATWFEPLVVVPHVEVLEEEEIYRSYQYDDSDEDDLYEDYVSRSPSIRIGNRRWGDNGYVRGGRREARPVSAAPPDAAVPSRTPKKKEASASASGSGSVSKDVAGRRARRAQKREAADKAAAEKHLKHLQRLGRGKIPEAPPEAEALTEELEEAPLVAAKALPDAPLEVGPQAI